jgi:molecular chaperone DnaK
MAYQLGIDLGTTFTCAAVCRSSDRRWAEPEVVTLGSRGATVPSVIFLGADGSVVVGEAAERRALTDPDRVVREFKRRIGDPTPVMVAGRPWAPQDLSARLVRWVVDRVAEREGGPADRISVTHPASWGQHKKEMLAAALAGQGLTVTFLAEPQAAALHYAANERVGSGSTIAVYDFGGGTFDAAVVRKRDTDFGLLGRPEGLERLGGIDFDQVVFEHVLEGMPGAFAELDETDPAVLSAVARIRRECTEAKEALSSDTEVSIPVLLPGSRGSVRLHRSEFEAMIRPQVEDTVSALRAAVISAGLAPDQLTAVLLVGGSSRIPLVAQLVSEQLGRPVAVDADPKNAIAKGAALALAPKPAEARPGGYAPPLPAGAAAGPVAPPARPPRMAPPPPGGPGVPYGGPYNDGQHRDGSHQSHHEPGPPPRGAPPRSYPPPSRPAPEPAAAVLTQPGPPPTRRTPQPEPDWDYDDYDDDYEPEPRRRRGPNVMAIGIGALLAVGAVVLAVILWPTLSGSSTGGADDGTQRTSAPASSGGRSGDSGSADRPNPPAAPPAAATTTRAPETSEEQPPPDSETTSEPTEPTDESDPDQSGDANGGESNQDSDSGGDAGEGDSNASGPVGDPIEPVADEVEEPGF